MKGIGEREFEGFKYEREVSYNEERGIGFKSEIEISSSGYVVILD